MVSRLCKKLRLSQSDFAVVPGVSTSPQSKRETGDHRPDAAAKLLRLLRQKPEYITV